MRKFLLIICVFSLRSAFAQPADSVKAKFDSLKNLSLAGLSFRAIGPGITGGRVIDIAVNPRNKSEYYVAAGHGSLWKTDNNGNTYRAVFENQKSYAIGAVKLDPQNPNIVWVGTGENNNQNNVIYGDGIYRSEDAGKSWKNMGLTNTEHITGIVIDPRNTNTVYVSAYGALRRDNPERGIYKTTDGGKTWRQVLYVSQGTGFYEIHMDPYNPNTLFAVAHQRQRRLYTGLQGGPESAIYRSLDSGATWQKIMKGLPSEDVGRIGMTISPVNPDIIYAIVQAKEGGGVYKSMDKGSSWSKQSSYVSAYPFYFQKLFADTRDENRLYSMDVFLQVSIDGGKTWKNLGEKNKHVDNHTMWIDPANNKHLLVGCDGGLYETFDQGANWDFKNNMSLSEIYRVSTDNALPFYNVYAGTQDNSSFMGPSRTLNAHGIANQDWSFTNGGDGFETQVDWEDNRTVYAQSQNGGLVRFDKITGERLGIQPVNMDDSGYRFDWDAALLISKHDHKRLYFGANKLFRTDDQGNTWKVISPDLSRGVPQKMQKLQGRSWSIDELASKGNMGQITAIAESRIDENLLFVGSGDGLLWYTNDGGKSWNRSATSGLPEYARINNLIASKHNRLVAYAAAQNYLEGDYKPYLLKTSDGGKTWQMFNANLPQRGSTYSIAEDHVDPNLLFAGTQFGLFFTNDGGREWIPFKNGLPVSAMMDMEIQQRENDLVVATFGRGIYILDDYSPLRNMGRQTLSKSAYIFPIKEAKMYIPASPFAYNGKGFQGERFFTTPNPEPGAVFTYYVKDEYKSLKERRREAEKKLQEKGEDVSYPSKDTLRKESDETTPYFVFTITDASGNVVRKLKANVAKGVQRITWDLRYAPFGPVSLTAYDPTVNPFSSAPEGYLVIPGKYNVSMSKFEDGKLYDYGASQTFTATPLHQNNYSAADRTAMDAFYRKVASLVRAINAAEAYKNELAGKLPYLNKAVLEGSGVPANSLESLLKIQKKIDLFNRKMNGDPLRARYEGSSPVSLNGRVNDISGTMWGTTALPTNTYLQSYDVAANQFGEVLALLGEIERDITAVENTLEKSGAPYTPGRMPVWVK